MTKSRLMSKKVNHKRKLFFAAFIVSSTTLLLPNCSSRRSMTSGGLIPESIGGLSLKKKAPPESQWNALGIWQKISNSPQTYIPAGYSTTLPRTDSDGTWFHDKRDDKRLFVPNEAVGSYSPSILRAEAKKITE